MSACRPRREKWKRWKTSKRKAPELDSEDSSAAAVLDGQQSLPGLAAKRQNLSRTCIHEVAAPSGYDLSKDEAVHGTLSNPVFNGKMAKTYPFQLDPFQSVSIACLERNESVLVSAHTSAGKTAVAEYAIAMSFRDKQRGSEVIKEVGWVIFDEIHYMKDRERGVVWEESIVFLPPAIKMVFLSATMSNATEFAEWICNLHKQPCHVVYTDFRPTPLQHYVFPIGGSGLYLVVDENGQFREDNFLKLQDTFAKQPSQLDGKKSGGPKASGRIAKGGNASGTSDIYRIVKMIMERKFQPVIIFSFSRRECEHHAMSMSKLDFNTEEEKDSIEQVFRSAIFCLSEEDRGLPAIELMLPLLKRGIAVHHSGLLPIIKELVELLFQEVCNGTEHACKKVVFTSVKKWDGDSNRFIGSGEYIQMEMSVIKDMVLGKPAPLISTFRLSYYTILNLLSRAEGQFTAEHVIRNSFHQFQYEKALPEVVQKITRLENEASLLGSSGENDLAEYHKLGLDISELEKKIMSEMIRPERALLYLVPGRLVKVRDGSTDWGWGVVVNVVRNLQHLVGHGLIKVSSNCPGTKEKAELNHEIQQLKSKMRDSQMLGHIDADGVLQLKGRAACLIDTGDELLITELMFNGTFNDLDHHQVASVVSCFVPCEKSSEQIRLRNELSKPMIQLQEAARKIAEVQRECKLDVNVEEYVESTCKPYLMDVIYCWSKIPETFSTQGATFGEVTEMTDIFEGSIIRLVRRLDEFLNQLKAAAEAVGEVNLESKFGSASESLHRGIMFANSLYL
ncbi:hypothetical protein D1007_55354 [Hordeum vulgare]|nr:hypothetical protein D1007_55354 [Hordeum vulgare]